jgi:hypothetical protein
MKTLHQTTLSLKDLWLRLGRGLAVVLLFFLVLAPRATQAQGTPNPPERMSYQGYLTDGNGVALGNNGPKNYDVIFRIWNDQSAGTSSWAEQQTLTVDKGYFSVLLGEGATVGTEPHANLSALFAASDASERYVEFTVKGIGSGSPAADVTILPRLKLLSSPYAFLARNAGALISPNGNSLVTSANGQLTVNGTITGNGSGLTGLTASQIPNLDASKITSGTVASGRLSGTYSGALTLNNSGNSFTGNGSGLTGLTASQIPNLDASKITSGTVADARLTANVALRAGGNTFSGNQAFTAGDLALDNSHIIYGKNASGTVEGCLWPRWSDNVTYLNFGASGFNIRNNGSGSVMFMQNDGKVGIGTTTPSKGALEIDSANGVQPGYNPAGYLNPSGAHSGSISSGGDISLWAAGWVFADTFVAFSDERIKNIQGQSDTAADLKTLIGIKVTDYTYKDTIAKGNRPQKKVVAQQVEQVYPQAVSTNTDVVPDIYQNATLKDGWVQLATHLQAGDRIKLIGEKEKGVYAVLEVRDGAFRTDFKPTTDQVFVYGREVKDFRTVDYQAISMLNVSATQELAKRVESLAASNAHLSELEQKARRVDALEREVAELRKMVVQLAEVGRASKQTAQVAPEPLSSAAVASLQRVSATVSLDR